MKGKINMTEEMTGTIEEMTDIIAMKGTKDRKEVISKMAGMDTKVKDMIMEIGMNKGRREMSKEMKEEVKENMKGMKGPMIEKGKGKKEMVIEDDLCFK